MCCDVRPGGVYHPVGPSSFPEGVPMTETENPKWWEYVIYWVVTYWWVLPLGAVSGLLGWWLWGRR